MRVSTLTKLRLLLHCNWFNHEDDWLLLTLSIPRCSRIITDIIIIVISTFGVWLVVAMAAVMVAAADSSTVVLLMLALTVYFILTFFSSLLLRHLLMELNDEWKRFHSFVYVGMGAPMYIIAKENLFKKICTYCAPTITIVAAITSYHMYINKCMYAWWR